MRFQFYLLFAILLFPAALAMAEPADDLVKNVVSNDREEALTAARSLRTMGQIGLDALFSEYKDEIEEFSVSGVRDEKWTKISDALDLVAMQKDAYSSGLYWYTDLGQAKREAVRSGRPLISLRLLGNLNEEFSCANSRFFRSILYSDPEIARILRNNFVLHWQSVRPAPKITIDYGDGRKIVRTITGNSIHYLLDANGTVLDALPGLYDPVEFATYLKLWSNFYSSSAANIENRKTFYNIRRDQLLGRWKNDLRRLGFSPASEVKAAPAQPTGSVPALRAAPVAVTKMAVELPSVAVLNVDESAALSAQTDAERWKRIGALRPTFLLSDESTAFIRRQVSGAFGTNPSEFDRMINKLKENISADTAKNEYSLHTEIYKLIAENDSFDVDQLNEIVYERLFLTPSSDEWLGLYFSDVYTGLDGNGMIF